MDAQDLGARAATVTRMATPGEPRAGIQRRETLVFDPVIDPRFNRHIILARPTGEAVFVLWC